MSKELEAVKDKKVWETLNNRVVTLKENHRSDTSTKWWHIEEDDYEWREDCMIEIPQYVQDLIVELEETEKELDRLQKKETPMKVNGYTNDWGCKVCDSTIEFEYPRCPYCGQKLDWSDEK